MRTKIYYLSDGEDGEVRYVGKTSNSLRARRNNHLSDVKRERNHRTNWLRAASDVRIHLIAEVEGDGCVEEIALIAGLRALGTRLVNTTAGGEGASGHSPSPETRARISAANTGRPVSASTRALISAAKIGVPRESPSAETRAKISEALVGRAVSDETRTRMSAAQKGRVFSAATRARMSAAAKARYAKGVCVR